MSKFLDGETAARFSAEVHKGQYLRKGELNQEFSGGAVEFFRCAFGPEHYKAI